MSKVELIYDADCPNVEAARKQLRRAFAQTGESPEWDEWDRSDPESPLYARQYGSPTILINGRDVAGGSPSEESNCCRLYWDHSGQIQAVPSVEEIVAALGKNINLGQSTEPTTTSGSLRAWLPIIPAIGVSLLPNLACPACWPAYAGILGAVGLGFLIDTTYLLPLTAVFLVVAVGALGWRAATRRGYGPFILGLLATAVVVVGKFFFDSHPAMYGGIVLLVGSSLWNSWPKRSTSASCPACEPAGQLHPIKTEISRKEVSHD